MKTFEGKTEQEALQLAAADSWKKARRNRVLRNF